MPAVVGINVSCHSRLLRRSNSSATAKGAVGRRATADQVCFWKPTLAPCCSDEIGDVPLALQVKLLRALAIAKCGPWRDKVIPSTRAHHFARSSRLGEGTRRRTFREDLYYRLWSRWKLPALREREDIRC